MRILSALLFVLYLTSCSTQAKYSDEDMYDIASILKDVNQAVDAELKFGNTANLTNEQIIENATQSISDKLKKLPLIAEGANISNYQMITEFQGTNAVMMVCDGDIALMEDAGCNAEIDKIYWHTPQPNTCQIKLDATVICVN